MASKLSSRKLLSVIVGVAGIVGVNIPALLASVEEKIIQGEFSHS